MGPTDEWDRRGGSASGKIGSLFLFVPPCLCLARLIYYVFTEVVAHQNDGFIYFVDQAMDTLYNIYTNRSTTVRMAIGDGMVRMLRNIGRLVSSSDRHLRPGCKTKY